MLNKKFLLFAVAVFFIVATLINISAFCNIQGVIYYATPGNLTWADSINVTCMKSGSNETYVLTGVDGLPNSGYGHPFGGVFDTCAAYCPNGAYTVASNSTFAASGNATNSSCPGNTCYNNVTMYGAAGPTVTIVTPTSDYTYTTGTTNYDATCVVGDGSVSEVIFTSNHTGSVTNYSYINAEVSNPSGNTYRYAMPSLTAGTYLVYEWFCNQTTGSLSDTDGPQGITINSDTSNCDVLFNASSGLTYPASFRVYSNCNSAFVLYRNGSIISNNSEQALGVGVYNFSVVRTDTQNYSNVYDEENFVIQQATGVVYAYLNNSRSNITIENGTSIWLNGSLQVGDATGTVYLYKNETFVAQNSVSVSNYSLFDSPGIYNISAIYYGNENYTGDMETWWVNVTSDNNPPYFTTIPANASINYGVSLSVDFDAVDAEAHFDSFGVNDSRFFIGATNGTLVNATPLTTGVYVMNVSINDSVGNYNWTLYRVTVNALTTPCAVLFNTSSPITYPNSFLVYTNCDSAYTLYRNGSSIGNNSEQALGAGVYNFTVIRTDNQNYTSFYDEENFVISQAIPVVDIVVTPSNTVTYPTQTSADATGCPAQISCSFYRNDSMVTSPDTLTLGVGTYNYTYNTSGNANYSNASYSEVVDVNQNNSNCSVFFNTSSPLVYDDKFIVYTNCDSSYALYRNGTGISNNSEQALGGGLWNFTVIRDDKQNYSDYYDEQYFTINPETGLVYAYLNNSRTNISIDEGTSIWLNATLEIGKMAGGVYLYLNNTQLDYQPFHAANYTLFDTAGVYNVSAVYIGDENYTSAIETWYVFVSVNNPPQFTTIPANASINYGASLNVDFDATDDNGHFDSFSVNDSRFFIGATNGTLINATSLSGGTYVLNISANDTEGNYNWTLYQVTVNAIAPPISISLTPSNTVTYPTQTNASVFGCPSQLICNFYKNNSVITSPDVQTLGIGTYNYSYNTSGNENYTSYITYEILNVNSNTTSCNVYFNESSPLNYSNSFVVYTDCDSAYTLYRNGSSINNNSEQALAAGTYNFTVVRNDTFNYTNYYNETEFVVQQATPTLDIIVTPSNTVTYPTETNASVSGCPSQITCTLYRNDTGSVSDPDAVTLGVGTYNYTYNTSGNENYSSASYSELVIVNQNTSNCKVYFNTSSPISYPNSFTVFTDCSSAYTLYRNGSSISNNSEQTLGAGVYNFTVIRTDQTNYTNYYNETVFVVQQATPTLNYYLNGVTNNATVTYPTTINASANTNYGTLAIYRNSTDVTSQNNVAVSLAPGYYRYDFNVTGNENYSSVSHTLYALVNQNTSNCDVFFNTTSPQNYPASFIVYTNCSSAYTLYRNGSSVTNNSIQALGVGTYNFTVIRTDSSNYTNYYDEENFVIQQATGVVYAYINNSRTNFTIDNNTYADLNATINTPATGNVKLYSNGTLINQGANTIFNITLFDTVGLYNISAVYDGNENYSADIETWWLNVTSVADITAPNISFVAETTSTGNYTRDYINANASAQDDDAVDTITIYLYNSTGIITESNQSENFFYNFTGLSDSTYYLNATANDSAGNPNSTETRTIILDNAAPYFTNLANYTHYGGALSYDINANDDGVGVECFSVNDTGNFSIDCSGVLQNATNLSDGIYPLNISVNDSLGNTNSSEIYVNVSSAVCGNGIVEGLEECDDGNLVSGDGCSSTCTTERRGGGGGGSYEPPVEELPPFDVVPSSFVADILQGEATSFTFTVTNNLDEPLEITVDYSGLSDFIDINPNDLTFTLQAGESNRVDVDIYADIDTLPDSYFGKIKVNGDGETKDIGIVINVKELGALFDISTKMVTRRVPPGSNAIANIELTNLGAVSPVDVTLYYSIIDFENNTIVQGEENLVVDNSLTVKRSLPLSENDTDTNYMFYARVTYPGGTAASADTFTTSPLPNWALFIIALILIIISTIVVMVLYQRNITAVAGI